MPSKQSRSRSKSTSNTESVSKELVKIEKEIIIKKKENDEIQKLLDDKKKHLLNTLASQYELITILNNIDKVSKERIDIYESQIKIYKATISNLYKAFASISLIIHETYPK